MIDTLDDIGGWLTLFICMSGHVFAYIQYVTSLRMTASEFTHKMQIMCIKRI